MHKESICRKTRSRYIYIYTEPILSSTASWLSGAVNGGSGNGFLEKTPSRWLQSDLV